MRLGIFGVLLFCLTATQAQSLRIGVLSDYEKTPTLEVAIAQMIREIDRTTGAGRQVSLEATRYGTADAATAQATYAEWQGRVDLVLVLGSLSAKTLALRDNLPTPVLALSIIDPWLQDLPYANGVSGKPNFTYIWQTRDLELELKAFSQIHAYQKVVVLTDANAATTVNPDKVSAVVDSLSETLDAELTIVPVSGSVDQVVAQLPQDVDAVYFTLLLSQSEAQIRQLIDALNERQIPTFAGNARLMEFGVLGTMANENTLAQAIRKLAIMVDDIATGGDLATMPVRLDTKENLYVNLATARKIQLPIPFEVLFTATLIGEEERSVPSYSFEEIAEKSLAANLNIQLSYQDLALTGVQVQAVRANLLPSLDAGLTGSQINPERASAAFNSPEQSLSGDLTLTQLIYSEQAIAGLKISQYLQQAQEYTTQAEILNVLLDTYTAYLNVLSAKTNMLIQQENLTNTRKNKELAGIRVNLGASNNADLFRWESEVALANQSVIEAQTSLFSAKLQLNTLLANSLEPDYEIVDVALEDDLFAAFSRGPIASLIKTPQSLQRVSDFLVSESQRINPNKRALLENIHAVDRQLLQNKRLQYTPTIALQAQTTQVLGRAGAGSTIDAQAMALGITEFQNNSWFAGVSLSYPIFNGLGRRAAVQESEISREQLGQSRTLLDQNLELGVRASVLNLLQASTNIQFSQAAAESAGQNFGLVQENYKQGVVTITQLIDAQQASLQAQLAAALSIYQYIQAHLQMEFNVGAFTLLMTEEEQQDLNLRLQAYLTNQN
ncbi:MAG: TolC family protein [Bacteroidota bacterium]